MTKNILYLLSVFLFSIGGYAQNSTLDSYRKEYARVKSDSGTCAKLYEKVVKDKNPDNTIQCYKGAVTAAMADYTKNKSEKLKLFREGKTLIEQSIAKDSSNVELRFLRFTVQSACPKALGYNHQIESDRTFIMSNKSEIKNLSVKKSIDDYFKKSGNNVDSSKK